jgi:hypothetical protein
MPGLAGSVESAHAGRTKKDLETRDFKVFIIVIIISEKISIISEEIGIISLRGV